MVNFGTYDKLKTHQIDPVELDLFKKAIKRQHFVHQGCICIIPVRLWDKTILHTDLVLVKFHNILYELWTIMSKYMIIVHFLLLDCITDTVKTQQYSSTVNIVSYILLI